MARTCWVLIAILLAPAGWAQNADRMSSGPTTVIGPRNPELQQGAEQLLAGNARKGVELTLRGLKVAAGAREEEAALSNLCAGYVMLENFDEALRYCEMLIEKNDANWRAYNNRALIYINREQYDKADEDLARGEALNPNARTLKVARAIYLNAVNPVTPEIEIDDRDRQSSTRQQ